MMKILVPRPQIILQVNIVWNRDNGLALFSRSSDISVELLDCDVRIVEVSAMACDVLQVRLRELHFAF